MVRNLQKKRRFAKNVKPTKKEMRIKEAEFCHIYLLKYLNKKYLLL